MLNLEAVLDLKWSAWMPLTEARVLEVPKRTGVYRIRRERGVPFPRLVGESEVLYVGKAGTNLRERLLKLAAWRACGLASS